MKRLRLAEWTALAGALGILLTLGRPWFSTSVTQLSFPPRTAELVVSGWDGLGWAMVALLVVSALLVIGLCVSFALGAGDAVTLPFGATVGAIAIPTLIALMVVLFSRPGLGINVPASDVAIEPAGWIGAAAMVLLAAGSLGSIRNERTVGADRHYDAPPPRTPPSPAAP